MPSCSFKRVASLGLQRGLPHARATNDEGSFCAANAEAFARAAAEGFDWAAAAEPRAF